MARPSLLDAGAARACCLSFSGQGSTWFPHLREYWSDPLLRPTIEVMIDAAAEEIPYVDARLCLPFGFAIRQWLDDPRTIPAQPALWVASVSVPMILTTQVAGWERLRHRGVDTAQLLERSIGLTGHSQGLIAAIMLSRAGTDGLSVPLLRQFAKYAFCLSSRAQETFPHVFPTDEEVARAAAADPRRQSPTPMVAVVGPMQDEILARMRRHNARGSSQSCIALSLCHSPTHMVLSGRRAALITFQEQHGAFMQDHKVFWVYIKSTCPFHSGLMNDVRPAADADLARIEFRVPGSSLRRPVFSSHDGRNLQHDEDAGVGVYMDVLMRALNWRQTLEAAFAGQTAAGLIDFGPGNEGRRLSRQTLRSLALDVELLSIGGADRRAWLAAS